MERLLTIRRLVGSDHSGEKRVYRYQPWRRPEKELSWVMRAAYRPRFAGVSLRIQRMCANYRRANSGSLTRLPSLVLSGACSRRR